MTSRHSSEELTRRWCLLRKKRSIVLIWKIAETLAISCGWTTCGGNIYTRVQGSEKILGLYSVWDKVFIEKIKSNIFWPAPRKPLETIIARRKYLALIYPPANCGKIKQTYVSWCVLANLPKHFFQDNIAWAKKGEREKLDSLISPPCESFAKRRLVKFAAEINEVAAEVQKLKLALSHTSSAYPRVRPNLRKLLSSSRFSFFFLLFSSRYSLPLSFSFAPSSIYAWTRENRSRITLRLGLNETGFVAWLFTRTPIGLALEIADARIVAVPFLFFFPLSLVLALDSCWYSFATLAAEYTWYK